MNHTYRKFEAHRSRLYHFYSWFSWSLRQKNTNCKSVANFVCLSKKIVAGGGCEKSRGDLILCVAEVGLVELPQGGASNLRSHHLRSFGLKHWWTAMNILRSRYRFETSGKVKSFVGVCTPWANNILAKYLNTQTFETISRWQANAVNGAPQNWVTSNS